MTNIQSGYLKTKNGMQLMTTVPYPIGAIYLSIDNTNPSKLFGGVWEQIAQGRTLVGVDTSQAEFNTVKKTGGAKTHTLTVEQMPKHKHPIVYDGNKKPINLNYIGGANAYGLMNWQTTALNAAAELFGDDVGGGQAHNNLQPYYTCYIWLRTA